jgi:tRNA threonylcarbamoyladenosine biosynthesis protein TsaE
VDPDDVSSPTFTLVNQYTGRSRVYHVDLYRLEPAQTRELGLEEMFDDPRAVVIVEWAERLGDLDVGNACRIDLTWVDAGTRKIDVRAD